MATMQLAGLAELTQDQATIDYPRPDRLLKGNPQRLTYNLYEHPQMNCGIWHCEVGAWQIQFSENKHEFFQIIEGIVRIHDAKTNTFIEVTAGNAGIIPPAFVGTFEVLATVKKYYVIVEA